MLTGPDGNEPLGASYDDAADVLYLWRGDEPAEALTLPTDAGPLIRLDLATGELVGVTLLDWFACWADKERIELDVPNVGRSQGEAPATPPAHRELVAA